MKPLLIKHLLDQNKGRFVGMNILGLEGDSLVLNGICKGTQHNPNGTIDCIIFNLKDKSLYSIQGGDIGTLNIGGYRL
jgi:hypothetical protein